MTLPNNLVEPFGDDIGCKVLDIGAHTLRFGYAGEDCPRMITPSYLGYQIDAMDIDASNSAVDSPAVENATNGGMNGGNKPQKPSGSYISGLGETVNWLPNTDVVNPISEGKITDWEAYEACWELALGESDLSNPSPFIVTSYPWASKKERELIAELAFEKFRIPALYIGNQATFTGFSFGKPTCLVLDVGAGTTSVTPIYDGRVIDGFQYQPLGGDHVTQYVIQDLKTRFEYDPTPHYLIQSKQPNLPAGQIPNLTLRPQDTLKDSFKTFMKNRLIHDFKETTCQVCETEFKEEILKTRPSKSYEFPDGFHTNFSTERFQYGEILFHPQKFLKDSQGLPTNLVSISALVQKTLESISPELRPGLCQNVVVTGGTTGMQGFNDRIVYDIMNLLYHTRVKVTTPNSTSERSYSSWLGASIMGSLGTFQQLMVSSRTYKDVGAKAIHEQFN